MKLLNCVLSYNRYYYLKNTVESLLEHFRFGDTVVVDDGSDDQMVKEYLAKLEHEGIHVDRRERWGDPQMYQYLHGGLYDNMDAGVKLAMEGGYDYIHFIQDDVQFVWHDPNLLKKVEHIFDTLPDASMVENIFFYGIGRDIILARLELLPQANCYHRRPHGMLDLGIASVALLKEHSFRFGNGVESTNSAWWRRHGYRTYRLHSPTMLQVPWPGVIRTSQEPSGGFKPSYKYFMKPLDEGQIRRLTSRPLEEIPFAEDYCLPWGWSCPTPYWNRPDNYDGYRRALYRKWRKRLSPVRKVARALVPGPVRDTLRALLAG